MRLGHLVGSYRVNKVNRVKSVLQYDQGPSRGKLDDRYVRIIRTTARDFRQPKIGFLDANIQPSTN